MRNLLILFGKREIQLMNRNSLNRECEKPRKQTRIGPRNQGPEGRGPEGPGA